MTMSSPTGNGRCTSVGGFTLLELLATISIVSILAALAARQALYVKQRASATQCSANHRALSLALSLYTEDSNQSLPPNKDSMGGLPVRNSWVAGSMASKLERADAALLKARPETALAAYVQDPHAYRCPSDPSKHVRSISLNCRVNPVHDLEFPSWLGGPLNQFRTYRTSGDVDRPSEIFSFVDEHWRSINEGYFAIDHSNTGDPQGKSAEIRPHYLVDSPAPYHRASTTFSFLDGHIELKRWAEPALFTQNPARKPSNPGQKPDLKWLHEHSSSLRASN